MRRQATGAPKQAIRLGLRRRPSAQRGASAERAMRARAGSRPSEPDKALPLTLRFAITWSTVNRGILRQTWHPRAEPPTAWSTSAGHRRHVEHLAPVSRCLSRLPRGSPRPPKASQGPPRVSQGLPKASQGLPRGPQGLPGLPKGLPRASQGPPRVPQVPPRASQGLPKASQGPPSPPRVIDFGWAQTSRGAPRLRAVVVPPGVS